MCLTCSPVMSTGAQPTVDGSPATPTSREQLSLIYQIQSMLALKHFMAQGAGSKLATCIAPVMKLLPDALKLTVCCLARKAVADLVS